MSTYISKHMKLVTNVMLLSILFIFIIGCTGVAAAENNAISVVYYYINACGTCDPEGEFMQMFNEEVGSLKDGTNVKFELYNTFNTVGKEKYQEYLESNNLSDKDYFPPIVVIGETAVVGDSAIREGIKNAFIKERDKILNQLETRQIILNYFFVTPCDACETVSEFLDSLEESYMVDYNGEIVLTQIKIEKHNVSEFDNLELVNQYFTKYNVPVEQQEVPIVFIGDEYFSGDTDIPMYLIDAIKKGEGIDDGTNDVMVEGEGDSDLGLNQYEVLGVFLTGLVNGLNPCSLSMLLFLISMLTMKKVNLLKVGFSFIAGKTVAYFLLGTLLFNIFLYIDQRFFSTFNLIIKIVMIVTVSIIIVVNLSDFIAAKNEKYNKIKLQLPKGVRKFNHNVIKKFTDVKNPHTLPLISFVLGIIISTGEFLCTGQVYLATILYVMKNSTDFNIQAALYFLIYVFALMIPLIIILLIVNKGRELFDVSEFIREKYHLIKLINIIVFTVFLLVIIFLF